MTSTLTVKDFPSISPRKQSNTALSGGRRYSARMKSVFALIAVLASTSLVPAFGEELPPPFPEVGQTYFVRYAPGVDNIYNTVKVVRVEPNGWLLVEVPGNKAFWINPAFIAMANQIETK